MNMNQNPDPSQPREPDPSGYTPNSPSYYGNYPIQPATTEYYHNPGMQQGQPGPNPGYPPPPGYVPPPPGASFPSPPGYVPPPPFMNTGMPPFYPAPKKKRTWLWVLIGSGIVLFVLLISACGIFFSSIMQLARSSSSASPTYSYSQQLRKDETQIASGNSTSNSNSTASSDTSSNNSSASSTDTGGASTVVNIGQKVTSNGVDCTLVSAQKIDGDGYAQPEAGNQLIVVHVKLENHSAKNQAYNVFDFHSISKGQVHSEFIFTPQAYTANNRLHYGEMLPGATVEGDIFFQVPINDHQAMVSWEPIWVYSETQYEWNLGL